MSAALRRDVHVRYNNIVNYYTCLGQGIYVYGVLLYLGTYAPGTHLRRAAR